MLIKIHDSYRTCVALCDKELIGKKFEDDDGKMQIDLSGTFFQGEEKSIEEIKMILLDARKEDASFNFVGEKSVGLAKELGIINEGGICEIGGVVVGLVLL